MRIWPLREKRQGYFIIYVDILLLSRCKLYWFLKTVVFQTGSILMTAFVVVIQIRNAYAVFFSQFNVRPCFYFSSIRASVVKEQGVYWEGITFLLNCEFCCTYPILVQSLKSPFLAFLYSG